MLFKNDIKETNLWANIQNGFCLISVLTSSVKFLDTIPEKSPTPS